MDVGRLRVPRELADGGSVSAVASALAFAPSAIFQLLRTLQREVGVALTEPAGRGLRLTDAGHALVGHADAMLAALARADAADEEYPSQPLGLVRIAMFASAARLLLAGLLRRVTELPQVEVRFSDVEMTTAEVPALTADSDRVRRAGR